MKYFMYNVFCWDKEAIKELKTLCEKYNNYGIRILSKQSYRSWLKSKAQNNKPLKPDLAETVRKSQVHASEQAVIENLNKLGF